LADVLRVEEVHRRFGGLRALNGVDLSVGVGERLAVIGPNGAGKTTLFNIIAGDLAPTAGRIVFDGQDVTRHRPYDRAAHGLARTFQKNNLFLGLSVLENVRLAVQRRQGITFQVLTPAASYQDVLEETAEVLARLYLEERQDTLARDLSYGEQRQLEVAVALACRPSLLLLDEPTAGMSPAETVGMVNLIKTLPREVTLLIIEHDMDVVFAVADRISVLHYGEVLAEGSPQDVRNNPEVLAVYLGTSAEANHRGTAPPQVGKASVPAGAGGDVRDIRDALER
jgi:branched-chain amino acid transport system ATP-binding protein